MNTHLDLGTPLSDGHKGAVMLYRKCQDCVNILGAAGEEVHEYTIVSKDDCWNCINEEKTMAPERTIRRRINKSISTKGIIQYDGTIEVTGGTLEEFMADQTVFDAELVRLQPQYEEFVEPV